ncbi:MAG TPA: hypothetical protein VGG46_03945 [Terriglobales bacterium]
MVSHTVAVIHHPEFPQVYSAAIDDAIACVDRVLLAHSALQLGSCQYEYPETVSGACNGELCAARATVFDLSEEMEYCGKHFREVSRG